MEREKYYISTAIAYTSGKPHIGNTYEIILAAYNALEISSINCSLSLLISITNFFPSPFINVSLIILSCICECFKCF